MDEQTLLESITKSKIETSQEENKKLEKIRDAFYPYLNAGIATNTWLELQKDVEQDALSEDYEETLRRQGELKIHVQDPEHKESYEHFLRFLDDHFKEDIIQIALVNAIHLNLEEVHVYFRENNILGLEKGGYNIPKQIFDQQWKAMSAEMQSQLSKRIHRGESFSNWYIEGYTGNKLFPCPIVIYNQEYDEKNNAIRNGEDLSLLGLEYLNELPPDKRAEAYVHGSLAHEIAHNIYVYLIYNTELQDVWKNIIDKVGNLTSYAQQWEDHNASRDYNENFAEAVRLYTTDVNYLLNNGYNEVARFISDNFPEIKPN